MKQPKPRSIHIDAVMNGFIVQVGCQTLVIGSIDQLMNNLRTYLEHPLTVEKSFRDGALYDTMSEPVACEPPRNDLMNQRDPERCSERPPINPEMPRLSR